MNSKPLLVIHAGFIADMNDLSEYNPQFENKYKQSIKKALQAGYDELEKGNSSLDAVTEAVKALEDCSYFDAGKGSVRDVHGDVTLDASIMRGDTQESGAVAYVSSIKNPVQTAKLVMEQTKHVLLVSEGAEELARSHQLEMVSSDYFFNPHIQHSSDHGTVGAVALDINGTISAATSTGGLTNKLKGRVGDSPIIGAGTYAKNGVVGLSATGTGEYFIRTTAAARIAGMMEFAHISLPDAMKQVLDEIQEKGGKGGFIGINPQTQEIITQYTKNCAGMFRGWINREGNYSIHIV